MDLAGALARLRQAAGLSRRQLEDVSGVSEETIKAIEYARNTRPTAETLNKLATGLATNRALGRLDQAAADEIVTTLMRAAGYVPPASADAAPPPDPEASRVRAALVDAGYDSNGADVVDAMVRELLTLTQSERDMLLPLMLAQIRELRSVARR